MKALPMEASTASTLRHIFDSDVRPHNKRSEAILYFLSVFVGQDNVYPVRPVLLYDSALVEVEEY